MGLGYEQLKAIKPDIISVSIKMWGNDGPLGYQTGYAPCFAALAGVASLVGYPGGPPLGTSMRYGDSTVGAAAAFAAVAALLHRELTGEGQFVDVSAVETLSSMIGDCLLAQELTGTQLLPDGNRSRRHVPARLLPVCRRRTGSALPWRTTTEWRRLCRRCSMPPRWPTTRATPPGGRATRHAEALDLDLAQLTRNHDAERLAQRLQSGRSAGRQERHRDGRHQRSAAVGPRAVPLRQRSPRRPAASARGRHGGWRRCRPGSRAVRPTSARTTTMF